MLLLFCCVSVCLCSNVCASFVTDCVVVYVFSVLFVCDCACVLFAKRVRVVCLRISVWCCTVVFVSCLLCLCVWC